MRARITPAILIFILGASSAAAQVKPPEPLHDVPARNATKAKDDPYRASFAVLDTDGNGFVSRREAEAVADVARRFARIDSDGDGRISAHEWSAYRRAQDAPQRRDTHNASRRRPRS